MEGRRSFYAEASADRPRRPSRGQNAVKVRGRVPRGSQPPATRGHRGRWPSMPGNL